MPKGKGAASIKIPTYYVGIHFVLAHGPVDKVTEVIVDEHSIWVGNTTGGEISINAGGIFGGLTREGGIKGKVDIDMGLPAQVSNTYLSNTLGIIPAFRGFLSAVLKKVYLGTSPHLKPWAFKVTRIHQRKNGAAQWQNTLAEVPGEIFLIKSITRSGTTATVTTETPHGLVTGNTVTISGATDSLYNKTTTITSAVWALKKAPVTFTYTLASTPTADAAGNLKAVVPVSGLINAVHVIRECLTDNTWGYGFSEGLIDETSFLAAAQTTYNEGMGFSFLWDQEPTIDKFISDILNHIKGNLYVDRADGLFHINLLRKLTSTTGLLELNDTNSKDITNFHRKSIGELVSRVTVEYINNTTDKTDTVEVHDLSLLVRQTVPVTQVNKYTGIASREVAQKIALRDLQQLSQPAYTLTIKTNRVAENLNVGEAFFINRADAIEIPLIFRVLNINLGTSTKQEITIDCIQDVFQAADLVFPTTPGSFWTSPLNNPINVTNKIITELPYYVFALTKGDTEAQAVASTDNFLVAAAAAPTSDAHSAGFWVDDGLGYKKQGILNFATSSTLASAINQTATSITLTTPIFSDELDGDTITVGAFIQIDNELLSVTAFNGTLLTVGRGVLDTVPQTHSVGARIYAWQDNFIADELPFLLTEAPAVKLTTMTGDDELALADATSTVKTITGRYHLPYPPGNFKINGIAYPASSTLGAATLTWSHRNRIQQTGALIDTTVGNIGPEAGTTYNAYLYSGATLLQSAVGISGTTHTFTGNGGDVLLLHCNGTNGSTNFIDEAGKVITPFGNAQISTAQSKFGGASGLFDGTNDYISAPDSADWYWDTDFTIEAWLYPTNLNPTVAYAVISQSSSVNNEVTIAINSSGQLYIRRETAAAALNFTSTNALTLNTWQHVAIVRSGSTVTFYKNGTANGSGNWTGNADQTSSLYIGGYWYGGSFLSGRYYFGYIDELRITKGIARYTANFTPPTAPFTLEQNILLTGSLTIELESERASLKSYTKHSVIVLFITWDSLTTWDAWTSWS